MPSTLRRASLLTLSLLAIMALTTGCRSTTDPGTPPLMARCNVTILVEMAGGVPVTVPDRQIVRPHQGIEWVTDIPDATIEIVWKAGNPLPSPPDCRGGKCVGAPPHPTSVGKQFEYDVRITTTTGTFESDPILIIRP